MNTDSMNVKRTKHAERSEATRAALMAAARPLFAQRGYAAVGTEEIVRAAGVTRGALYHQFADKRELFAAVFEAVEAHTTRRIANEALAGATPYLRLFGSTLGGCMLANEALAAHNLGEGAGDLGDRDGVVIGNCEVGADPTGPVDEQLDGLVGQ